MRSSVYRSGSGSTRYIFRHKTGYEAAKKLVQAGGESKSLGLKHSFLEKAW